MKAAYPGKLISAVCVGGRLTRTGIGTIVDMTSLEFEGYVAGNFTGTVYAGQPTITALNAYPGNSLPGENVAVIPAADRARATSEVRIRFVQSDLRELPKMGVRVSSLRERKAAQTAGSTASQSVVVPTVAIQMSGATGAALVIRHDVVERPTVQLGAHQDTTQVVVSGLAVGDRVVIGNFN